MSARRGHPLLGLREQAALMLMRASPVARLEFHEACIVIDAMKPVYVQAGEVLMREGDSTDNDYMALLIDGQVRVESATDAVGGQRVISVIDAGSLIGEMGLIDDAPRSATCTALTPLKLATLSRTALSGLVEVQPAVAARLLLSITKAMSQRLRESNHRLRSLSQITRAVQMELDAAHAVNRRLLEAAPPVAGAPREAQASAPMPMPPLPRMPPPDGGLSVPGAM